MTLVSFSRKIVDSVLVTTYELGGRDAKGRDVYYFLKVPAGKNRAFQQALNSGAFDLKEYGIIITSGFGTDAPEAIRLNVMNGNL